MKVEPIQIKNSSEQRSNVDIFLEENGFNLTQKDFHEAFYRAISARNAITHSYPKTSKGTYFYHELISSLREICVLRGYSCLSCCNVELTTNGNITIHTCCGDDHVGNVSQYPYSKRKIGSATKKILHLIENNNPISLQIELFEEKNEEQNENIWTLFYNIVEKSDGNIIINAELSKAKFFNKKSFINGLDTRIIFDPIILNPNLPIDGNDIEFNDNYDIDISVTG